ncbi:PREDICTED: uncharacterized protein LOC104595838 isoform X2 [Nelumbo nucifera]|uniref:Uncharacterized protein LOC104595838 isoform X2 n=1 Tax=Nelumbo nucifera TaxID=4432 RepID=A0A1U7ZNZ4_NELNU|nr:PREDICTED: uncharacterized protein LOC104595838 isoform X2 [Nelumbo nucifera]
MGRKPARKPCFFKILIGEDFTERLGIPRKFIRKFGEDVSSVAVLMVRDANIWDIGLSKDADGRVWLQNGWQEFVEYYRLCEGKILFFRYDGDSCFCVFILDMSEIQYPRYPKNYEEENLDKGKLVDKGERQEEDCMEFLAEFPTRTYSQKVIDGCDNQRTAKASTDNTPLQRHSCQPFNGDKTCSEMLPSKPAIVATYKRKKTEDNGKLRTLAAGNAFKSVQQNNPQDNAFNFENEVGVAPNHSITPDRMNDNHQKSTKNTKNVLSFAPFSSRDVDLQLVNGSEQTETPRNDTESPCPKPKYGNGEISSPEQENQIARNAGGYTSSTEHEVSEVTANIRARSKVSVSKRKSVVNEEKCGVIYGHQFQSENPFFTVIMESWHLCKGPSLMEESGTSGSFTEEVGLGLAKVVLHLLGTITWKKEIAVSSSLLKPTTLR